MGKHSKTEMQEKVTYEGAYILPSYGQVLVPKNKLWDSEKMIWVQQSGRHSINEDFRLNTYTKGSWPFMCDVCKGKSGLPAVVWDDLHGDVCNLCLIKRIVGRGRNFMTGEKIPEGIRYPAYLLQR